MARAPSKHSPGGPQQGRARCQQCPISRAAHSNLSARKTSGRSTRSKAALEAGRPRSPPPADRPHRPSKGRPAKSRALQVPGPLGAPLIHLIQHLNHPPRAPSRGSTDQLVGRAVVDLCLPVKGKHSRGRTRPTQSKHCQSSGRIASNSLGAPPSSHSPLHGR